MHAAVYLRSAQKDSDSIGIQRTQLREFAARNGMKVTAEFVDAGISGTTMKRPGLQALLKVAEKHKFDALLVYDLPRLSRSIHGFCSLLIKLHRLGVKVILLEGPELTDDLIELLSSLPSHPDVLMG